MPYSCARTRGRQLALVLLAVAARATTAADDLPWGAHPGVRRAAAKAAAAAASPRKEPEVLLAPGARADMAGAIGAAQAAEYALGVFRLGACAREWDADQEAYRRAAYVAGCGGVLTCGRPSCAAWVPWAPWQWREPDDRGVRLLPPGEPAPPRPAAAAVRGGARPRGAREPVLRAAACPAEERAARGGARLAERWAVAAEEGGWGAATPVAAFHREPRLQACLTEAAGAWLPGPLVRALSWPSRPLEAAGLGGGGGGGGGRDGGIEDDWDADGLLSLFEFDGSLWPQLVGALKADAERDARLLEQYAVRPAPPPRRRRRRGPAAAPPRDRPGARARSRVPRPRAPPPRAAAAPRRGRWPRPAPRGAPQVLSQALAVAA
jgi:hypothetical protein